MILYVDQLKVKFGLLYLSTTKVFDEIKIRQRYFEIAKHRKGHNCTKMAPISATPI